MTDSQRLPLISLALLSASALGTELYLVRLFAIIQWHHAAYMIISLALLGYGVSGSVLALSRGYLLKHFKHIYPALIAAYAVIFPTCLWFVQRLDFNAELLLWRADAWISLAGTYLLLTIPFLVAAMVIGLVLDACRTNITRLYAADLTGAGVGALAMVMFMQFLPVGRLPLVLVTLSLLGAAIALYELGQRKKPFIFVLLGMSIMAWFLPGKIFEPQVSEFKPLSQTLRIKDTKLVNEISGPLGMLSVVESPTVPFRHAPGLSFSTPGIPGEQLALFHDAAAMSAINRIDPSKPAVWFDWMPSALPYHIGKPVRVLIAGAGGGMDAQQALMLSDAVIDIVEPDSQHIELIRERYGQWSSLGEQAGSRLSYHSQDVREYLSQTNKRYDLIILSGGGAGTAGLQSLETAYMHTVDAYHEYLDHLTTTGKIVINSWLQLPSRTVLKHVASAAQALRERGVANTGNNVMLIRSLQTATLLFGNQSITANQITSMQNFADERGYDLAWYPQMPREQANRYNRMNQPWLHDGTAALLGQNYRQYLELYKFNIMPATDDRPYFSHFFRWELLPEIIDNRGRGGMALVEGGYLVLLATLVQAFIAGALLILLPLVLFRQRTGISGLQLVSAAGYFLGLGLAFLVLEIVFVERLTLVLGHPIYAVAVALSGFLVFAGIGSALTSQLKQRIGMQKLLWSAIGLIAVAALLHILAGDWMVRVVRGLPDITRIPVVLLLLAPLALPMGVPFPLGLSLLANKAPAFIPWAWGLNGFASVISAVLAAVLALHFGFSITILVGVVLYLFSAMLLSKLL